jgi:hypothetical protein
MRWCPIVDRVRRILRVVVDVRDLSCRLRRRFLVGAFLLGAALFLAACGSAQRPADHRPLRVPAAREQAWISKLEQWLETEMSQGSFRDCSVRTGRDVGVAPSRDLAQVEASLASTCATFARYHADEDAALRKHSASLYERSRSEEAKAEAALTQLREVVVAYRPGKTYTELPLLTNVTDASRVEPNFGRVASAIAGRQIRVRCWSASDWPRVERDALAGENVATDYSGFAWYVEQAIDLAPPVCHNLAVLRYRHSVVASVRFAYAVGVLAHEASHLISSGEDVEWKAECFGMQRIRRTATLLGLPAGESSRLADLYWRRIYPDDAPGYTSPDCHNGGLLDLQPGSSVWP